jgi:photosystem II stability/assembly factor-like uncharacterized protein
MRIRVLWVCLLFGLGLATQRMHAQFDMEESHTTASLRGIAVAGPGIAWASGSGGTVRRTEDGGYLWQICTTPPDAEKLDFRAIQAFDANTAFVMSSGKGHLSRVYKTTDGCQTWTQVFENPDADGFFDAMILTGLRTGTILGDPVGGSFAVFVTSDGGLTWRREKTPASAQGAGAFAASNSSLLAAERGIPAMFGTGGPLGAQLFLRIPATAFHVQWQAQAMPEFPAADGAGIFSIAAGTMKHLVAVGGAYQKPMERAGSAAFSNDGGRNWKPAQSLPGGYRSAVVYDRKHKAWLTTGPGGTDVSFDDGLTWRPVQGDEATGWNAIALPFVVGAKGRVGKIREEVWAR